MMKSRAGQNQTVDKRDSHTNVYAFLERVQHPARRRSVYVQIVIDSPVRSRDHHRLIGDHESDVADESFLQDLIDRCAIKLTTLRQASQFRALGRNKTIHYRSPMID